MWGLAKVGSFMGGPHIKPRLKDCTINKTENQKKFKAPFIKGDRKETSIPDLDPRWNVKISPGK